MKTGNKLWIGLIIMAALSPLGLLLPEYFKSGSAWGEWGADEIGKFLGYVPKGLERLSNIWKAPFPDYAFGGWEEKGLGHVSLAYIFSAVLGISVVVLAVLLLGRIFIRKKER